jgi:hypothetical protein
VESLKRVWTSISTMDIERSRNEDELVEVIAARTGDGPASIRSRLATLRVDAAAELLGRERAPAVIPVPRWP